MTLRKQRARSNATIMREGNGVMRMTMASLVALSVTAMTSGAALGQTIRIGASVALSGPLSREGQLLRERYAFWADHINQSGGISVGGKRHTVQLVVYDNESNAATSERLTEKLITQNKGQFLLGPYSSPITLETSLIGEKYSVRPARRAHLVAVHVYAASTSW
jgi:branched-chain amino acid transport system substrate-binding protein